MLSEAVELLLLTLVAEVLVDERRRRQIDDLQVGLEPGGRGGQAEPAAVFDVRGPVVDEVGVVALLHQPAAQGIGLQRGAVVVAEMESEDADVHLLGFLEMLRHRGSVPGVCGRGV
ncbi:hypothetical protein FQZ97_1177770 [compost metagenome]